jgi:hypothetical protein
MVQGMLMFANLRSLYYSAQGILAEVGPCFPPDLIRAAKQGQKPANALEPPYPS